MMHAYNTSTGEVETGGSEVQSQPQLCEKEKRNRNSVIRVKPCLQLLASCSTVVSHWAGTLGEQLHTRDRSQGDAHFLSV